MTTTQIRRQFNVSAMPYLSQQLATWRYAGETLEAISCGTSATSHWGKQQHM